MDSQALGKAIALLGGILVLVGVAVYVGGKLGFFGLGRLPGDIRVERENFSFYFPLATCILISIVVSALLYFFGRLR